MIEQEREYEPIIVDFKTTADGPYSAWQHEKERGVSIAVRVCIFRLAS
jgi:hypothetical protein